MTDPIGTAQEREMIENVAQALYEHWVAEDFANDYAPWEQLGDKATWQSRAGAVLQSDSLQSRIAEATELRAERDALLEEPISLAKMDSIDEDASGKMVAYYWWKQAQEARAALSLQRRV